MCGWEYGGYGLTWQWIVLLDTWSLYIGVGRVIFGLDNESFISSTCSKRESDLMTRDRVRVTCIHSLTDCPQGTLIA